MQYLILLCALLSLAAAVFTQDVETSFDEGDEAATSQSVLDSEGEADLDRELAAA
jgi:hypothetical protein